MQGGVPRFRYPALLVAPASKPSFALGNVNVLKYFPPEDSRLRCKTQR